MTTLSKIDKAIMKVITEAPEPISIKNLMFKLDRGGLHEGKSMRTIADRVYALRKQGLITQVGVAANVRYTVPDAQAAPAIEQERQLAEARQREASAAPTSTPPKQLGECDLIDLGAFYIIEPRTPRPPTIVEPAERSHEQNITPPPPTSVIVLDSRERVEPPFDSRVAAIAQHIGTTVTLTVQQLIGEALREKETTIKMQSQHIASLDSANEKLHNEKKADAAQIDQLKKDMSEQEQLYNELDTKYNTLRRQLAGLAA
jgi:hypothetical protein